MTRARKVTSVETRSTGIIVTKYSDGATSFDYSGPESGSGHRSQVLRTARSQTKRWEPLSKARQQLQEAQTRGFKRSGLA